MTQNWKSFFDPDRARGPKAGPDVSEEEWPAQAPPGERGPVSVSALVAQIKHALEEKFPRRVTVVGEISNLTRHTSGHMYFRLKDADAAIDVTMFRSFASRLKFRPEDGLEVIAEGHVDVYEVRGQLQLRVEHMTPKGAGALELAFRQLCEKLRAEGLFDPVRKKAVPRFPRGIGVVTSPTGAAVRDIRRTLARRWPAARVYLVPALVQGEGAGQAVAEGIRLLDAAAGRLGIDTIIVARGGGSLEDLWAFNEEAVARAIFASRTPVISGVGHETDVTIADMVADRRAATPTAAAELAAPDAGEVRGRLAALGERLARRVVDGMRAGRVAMEGILRSAVFRDPLGRVRTNMQHVDELSHRLVALLHDRLACGRRRLEPAANRLAALHPARLHERAAATLAKITSRLAWALGRRSKQSGDALSAVAQRLSAVHPRHRLTLARQQAEALARQLESMSYRHVLGRGYSVTRRADGAILRSVANVGAGDAIRTELRDGKVDSRVTRREGKDAAPPAGTSSAPPGDADTGPAPKRRKHAKTDDGPMLFELSDEE